MWYIGQKIVCIKKHPDGCLVVEDIYNIKGLKECCSIAMDIGLKCENGTYCVNCRKETDGTIWYINSKYFMPLEYDVKDSELVNELTNDLVLIKK